MKSTCLLSLILLSSFSVQGMKKEEEKGKESNKNISIHVYPVPGTIDITEQTTISDLKNKLQAKYNNAAEWSAAAQTIRACKKGNLQDFSEALSNHAKVKQAADFYKTDAFIVSAPHIKR